MGTLYTTQTISNFNQSPPANDATQVASNQLDWTKHVEKLATPIKDLVEAVNTAVVNHVDITPAVQASGYTTVADDHGRTIVFDTTVTSPTCDLLALASAPDGYHVYICNLYGVSNTNVTVGIDGAGSIHGLGTAKGSFVVNSGACGHFQVSHDKGEYMLIGSTGTVT